MEDIWTGDIRDNELLNVVDDLLSHHDDEELLSQFYEAAPGTTLQQSVKTHRNMHSFDTARQVWIKIQHSRDLEDFLFLDTKYTLTSSFLIPNKVP